MLTKSTLAVLSRAADEGLPRTIDEADPRVDLAAFRELYRAGLIEAIDALRQAGETVVEAMPGEVACDGPMCSRQLVENAGRWIVQEISGGLANG